jgi:hypothetical protein
VMASSSFGDPHGRSVAGLAELALGGSSGDNEVCLGASVGFESRRYSPNRQP